MPNHRTNIEGQRFGRLVALHDVGRNKRKLRLWECLCDCGKLTVVPMSDLKKGGTNSCGCLKNELSSKRAKKSIGESSLTFLFHVYKIGARKRGLEFLLTRKQFKKLTQRNCFYCNEKPYKTIYRPGVNGKFIYNGIDRKDNTKGYTIDNCVTCCSMCNNMKHAYTQQDFLTKVGLIYNYMLKEYDG